jgi:hypothetical protein
MPLAYEKILKKPFQIMYFKMARRFGYVFIVSLLLFIFSSDLIKILTRHR